MRNGSNPVSEFSKPLCFHFLSLFWPGIDDLEINDIFCKTWADIGSINPGIFSNVTRILSFTLPRFKPRNNLLWDSSANTVCFTVVMSDTRHSFQLPVVSILSLWHVSVTVSLPVVLPLLRHPSAQLQT